MELENLDYRGDIVSIPKIIMQTWKTSEVPEEWQPSVDSIEKHMPEWSRVLMTDEQNREFVAMYFPDFIECYDNFEYDIQRADAFRYCWLYINGGIYMDLDYVLNEPLDSLFWSDSGLYLAASSNFPSSLTNSFMASVAGHEFWLDVIEEMKKNGNNPRYWAYFKHLKVMMSTGPGLINTVARRSHYTHTVIPPKLLCPDTLCGPSEDQGMMSPLKGCSWGSWDTRLYNWCFCNSTVAIFLGIFLIILLIVLIVWLLTR